MKFHWIREELTLYTRRMVIRTIVSRVAIREITIKTSIINISFFCGIYDFESSIVSLVKCRDAVVTIKYLLSFMVMYITSCYVC